MFRTFSKFMRVRDLRTKIIFTLLMLIVFRIGTFVPVPGVNAEVLNFGTQSAFGVLNIFGGGALQNFSIFAAGIMPYITASIIMQLLQMDVVPKLTEWRKQGEVGRKKIAQVTRYVTVVIAFVQGLAMSYGFNAIAGGLLIEDSTFGNHLLIALVLTTGTAFLLWLGETITEKGVGNGISIIIFAGIVAAIPSMINQIYLSQLANAGDQLFIRIVILALLLLLILAIIVGVIFVQQAVRKIPIQYAKRVAGNSSVGGNSSHIPLKVNSAGVIPIIFAISFLITPPTIAGFFRDHAVAQWIIEWFDYSHPFGMVIYVALIIAFTYFYAFVQVNPEQMADNLKKQGGYVPGRRPGKQTQDYFTGVLYRLTFVGSIFLAVVAILPVFFTNVAGLPASVQIGGTSLLIVIGVALDTMKQLESQLVKRHYKGFIK
ncbi:preprotein translocase subunit SecY [Caldibacillus thermolactis]|jgi:preprotein translocase subunit SecY|uniref:Protein translocase subunit SecY n=1 Tax=Pallidibacillus thermolactis TaxID=251051 RepID=A0ABT2WEE4_9BACI|nr:preprotein translocase subunit SecY [Pallidibacillus thermolactis]MCU9594051.1 preprotein translocase subunit SecY [Pallidibacillus thermolactis]MCU9602210.1 preprotein translocase subunit SecY [Pallidibacillus thermolactis subsp. kokeshiiformis]MED1673217.1 preprotein translocase subunit SecY [Pallidibacillus thermolactis subsp. kokeshiiformis]